MNNNAIIDQLINKGIQFAKGLTEAEFQRIEEIYNVRFPGSLRRFYSLGLPDSEDPDDMAGFPRWTDFSAANIAKIKERIQAPIHWVCGYIKRGFWIPNWGKRPKSTNEAIKQFMEIAMKAPRLIPIYSHRYMPQLDGVENPPVISTVGIDIIYYGSDLHEYLQNEFQRDGDFLVPQNCVYIPFWGDIINYNGFWE